MVYTLNEKGIIYVKFNQISENMNIIIFTHIVFWLMVEKNKKEVRR